MACEGSLVSRHLQYVRAGRVALFVGARAVLEIRSRQAFLRRHQQGK